MTISLWRRCGTRVGALALAAVLAGCSTQEAQPAPTETPTTAAPTTRTPGPPRSPAAVQRAVGSLTVPGMPASAPAAGTRAVVDLCPVGQSVRRPMGADASVRQVGGLESASRGELYAAALTFPDDAAAAAALAPVLADARLCPQGDPRPSAPGSLQANGIDITTLELAYAPVDGATARHEWVGVARVDNVLVRLTFSGQSAQDSRSRGEAAMRSLVQAVDAAR